MALYLLDNDRFTTHRLNYDDLAHRWPHLCTAAARRHGLYLVRVGPRFPGDSEGDRLVTGDRLRQVRTLDDHREHVARLIGAMAPAMDTDDQARRMADLATVRTVGQLSARYDLLMAERQRRASGR